MDHASDDILTRLAVADPADADPALRGFQDHVASCSECRLRLDELRATWALLDQWRAEPGERDLTQAVLAAAESSMSAAELPKLPLAPTVGFWRMAASIVLAISVGVFGALAVTSPARTPIDRDLVQERSLLLPQFQNASPGMFAESILGFVGEPEAEAEP